MFCSKMIVCFIPSQYKNSRLTQLNEKLQSLKSILNTLTIIYRNRNEILKKLLLNSSRYSQQTQEKVIIENNYHNYI